MKLRLAPDADCVVTMLWLGGTTVACLCSPDGRQLLVDFAKMAGCAALVLGTVCLAGHLPTWAGNALTSACAFIVRRGQRER